MPAVNMEALKKVPKPVWIVGGGVILAWFLLKGKGSTGAVAGVGSSGGGGGDQDAIASTDLDQFLADQAQNQADFLQSIGDAINGGSGTGGASGSTPGGTGGTTGTGTSSPTNRFVKYVPPTTTAPAPSPAPTTRTTLWGADVPTWISSGYSDTSAAALFKKYNINYATKINMIDLTALFKKANIDYKTTINPIDLKAIGIKPLPATSTTLPTAPVPTAPAPITKTVTAAPAPTPTTSPIAVRR